MASGHGSTDRAGRYYPVFDYDRDREQGAERVGDDHEPITLLDPVQDPKERLDCKQNEHLHRDALDAPPFPDCPNLVRKSQEHVGQADSQGDGSKQIGLEPRKERFHMCRAPIGLSLQ